MRETGFGVLARAIAVEVERALVLKDQAEAMFRQDYGRVKRVEIERSGWFGACRGKVWSTKRRHPLEGVLVGKR